MSSRVLLAAVLGVAALALPAQSLAAGADNFASAPLLSGSPVTDGGSNATATTEAGEPKPAGWTTNPTKTLWWTWQAPSGGTVTIDTCTSGFDTRIAAWTGMSVTTLTHVASNDDGTGCSSVESRMSFSVVGGQRYRIQADGFNGATGTFVLHITHTPVCCVPPPNDNLANAVALSGDDATAGGGNGYATKEGGESDHFGLTHATTSIWWAWTAATGGSVTVDTCTSTFDTVLAVYTGAVFPLAPVASNDDSPCASQVTFAAQAGVIYRIAVAGFAGSTGWAALHVVLTPDTAPPDTSITGGPSGAVTSDSAEFALVSTEVSSTFACSLDGGAFAACSTPKSYAGLAVGSHTFAVRATDPYGNTDTTPATRSWSVLDSPAPDTAITSPSGEAAAPSTESGTPAGPAAATSPPAPDTTPPTASLAFSPQKLGKVLKSGKLLVKVTTSEAGSIAGSATSKALTVAAGGAAAPKAGTYSVTLKLTKKAKKKFARLKKVRLTLRVRVSDSSGNRRVVTKVVTLKR